MTYLSGIRGRLMILISLCLAPLALLVLWHLNHERNRQVAEAQKQLAVLTHQIASKQIGQINDVKTRLKLLASLPAIQTFKPTVCDRTLRHQKMLLPFLTAIYVTDVSGKVRCTTTKTKVDLSNRDYIHQAITERRFALSDDTIDQISNRPVLIGALPIENAKGTVSGVVAATIDLAWIQGIAKTLADKLDASVTIIDSRGRTLARVNNRGRWDSNGLASDNLSAEPFIKTILAQREGQMTDVRIANGPPSILTFGPLSHSSATVIAKIAETRITDPINRILLFNLVALVTVCIVSLGVAIVFANRDIIVWIDALKDAADHLQAEDFSHRTLIPNQPGEIRELALSFVKMGQRVREIAHLDRLTQLPNKNFLDHHLKELTGQIKAQKHGALAILYIDLDSFNLINENYGRQMGDRILLASAERLRKAMPENGVLARVAGAEFIAVLVLDDNPGARYTTARKAAERLIHAFAKGIAVPDIEDIIPVGCSIGLSVWSRTDQSLDEVIRDADDALFRAKRQGRHCFVIVHNAVSEVAS